MKIEKRIETLERQIKPEKGEPVTFVVQYAGSPELTKEIETDILYREVKK